ncbi:MAG TPA: N-6 DNA methylase [Blastocatellia bacterium]|nr:N-6 DNA methylase [Blastocatellia bacterium]
MRQMFFLPFSKEPPGSFLKEAYRSLGYEKGALLEAVSFPSPGSREMEEWLQKGDWLSLAKKVGAEKVFFVNDDPVIVFCEVRDSQDATGLIKAFRQAWCMARPQCLFLALPGELRVYSLNRPPAKSVGEWQSLSPLAVANSVLDVAVKLNAFRREQVESGRLFEERYFGNIEERADRRLIHDLKAVRQALLDSPLKKRYAHALIGRSIFVRYLEDREVLIPKYFELVAKGHPAWEAILSEVPEKPALTIDLEKRRYDRVLRNKDFTYALFNRLAEDFNGDMFPRDLEEEQAVDQHHLNLLRGFLLGESNSDQPTLFFWAYDFEIIPIELISSIYEEFYHENNEDDKGTHYTPSVLVEYVLSRALTSDRLATNPKVLDPACGSGIFLVEAFRRMVRFSVQRQEGSLPSPDELRQILRNQIRGIEINTEATHVAAFSLYLALLHYQKPPDILASKRLPYLIHAEGQPKDEHHYHLLFNSNAFSLTPSERVELQGRLEQSRVFTGRAEVQRMLTDDRTLDIELHSFDIIVGNPPWSEAGSGSDIKKDKERDDGRLQAIRWAKAYERTVGDKSYSQLFIYRTLSLVKDPGVIGLLVHSSVIFNQRSTSQEFRQVWLSESTINEVVNFVHVRRLFFDKSIAPFIFVHFGLKNNDKEDSHLIYVSARRTRAAERLRTVVLTNADQRIVRKSELKNRDYLWKTYWWGTHRDSALLAVLDAEVRLKDLLKEDDASPGYGFQRGGQNPSDTLKELKPLKSEKLRWYGPLRKEWFEDPPKGVKRQPDERLYQNQRLIVVRGIKASYGACARLEYDEFSFRHTIYCVPLPSLPTWQAKLILGIFWSSLGRYRLFMTSGSWGAWYDQTVPSDILLMPVRIPEEENAVVKRIVSAVDSIRSLTTAIPAEFLQELNTAIFDLFGFTAPERDLVNDFLDYKFDLLINGADSAAQQRTRSRLQTSQGTIANLPTHQDSHQELEGYLYAFLQVWNRELEPNGEFRWRVIRPRDTPMVAVVFTTQEKGSSLPEILSSEKEQWELLLARCEEILLQPVTQRIYIDAIVRAVTDTDIFIIKRDERWLWTRSVAREDAEATLLQAMQMQASTLER